MPFLFAVTAVLFAVASDNAQRGTLCFVEKKAPPKCQPSDVSPVRIAPADVARLFVWTGEDGKTIVAGIAPALAEAVAIDGESFRDVTLSIRGAKRRGWPADVHINIVDAARHEWDWVVPRKRAENVSVLRVPPGRYTIAFTAEHHATEQRRIPVQKNATLREIVLKPLPMISARVVAAKDEPVAGARIVTPDGRIIATSDEQGAAHGELVEPVPDSVLIEKAGFGTRLMPLEVATGDVDLGVIRLGRGNKITLRVNRADAIPLTLRIARKNEFKYEHTPIATRELPAGEQTLTFDDISSGKYFVTAEGKQTSERMTTSIDVGDADVDQEISIRPFRLEGSVRIGDDPLTGGSVGIQDNAHTMRISLPIDSTGHFGATMWQHGQLHAFVTGPGLEPGEFLESPDVGADPSTWNIAFPKRFITGRISDADTKQPVASAKISLLVTRGESRFYTSVQPSSEGRFSIAATRSGTYELKVEALGYAAAKQVVEIRDGDDSVQRDIAMSRGVTVAIQVSNAGGEPAAGAEVIEGLASDGHNPERLYATDGSGNLTLQSLPGQSRTLYVLPKEGSFSIVHIVTPRTGEAKPIQVIVPPAVGSLRVRLEKGSGLTFGMRYNGEEILQSVWMRLPHAVQDAHELLALPAGTYELWPVDLRTRAPRGAAKTVGISRGRVEVDLRPEPAR